MRLSFPKPDYRARLGFIAFGLSLLIWISLEDHSALAPAILGAMLANFISFYWLLGRIGGKDFSMRFVFLMLPLLGAFNGAASAFIATALMFFKTAWHAHPFPEYPPEMLLAMLSRIPFWAFAGAFIGLALGFCILLTQDPKEA